MLNSSTTSFTVTPLQPNTTYFFRLVAENEAGMGKSTAQILITTSNEKVATFSTSVFSFSLKT